MPPEGSDYSNPDSILELEQEILPLFDLCKHLYMMGDLHARCGTVAEFNDFDLSHVTADCYGIDDRTISFINNAHELCTNGIPMVRKSADKTKNNFGNKLLQLCRNNNLYICNGRICPDSSSDSTCIKGSVIDYLIANISGLVKINNFTVHEFTPILSDVHCAISFSVNIKVVKKQIEDVQVRYQKWESTKRLEFVNNLDRHYVKTILTKLHSQNFDINTIVSYINSLFIKTAKNTFKKPIIISTKVKRSKPWFGLQCRKAQKKYYTAKRLNHIQNSNASRRKMINSCKKYKSIMNKYRKLHLQKLQNNIRKMRTSKPKDYWKLINSIDKKRDKSPVSMESLFNFLKTLDINDIDVTQQQPADLDAQNDVNGNNNTQVLNDPITESEIFESIKTLKLNKSSGNDDIVNEYIISTKHIMMPIYIKLFNAILETGVFQLTG